MSNREAKTYDFVSAGQSDTSFKKQFSKPIEDQRPIGILTPITFGHSNDGLFKMSKNLRDQIRDNFRNMLSTNWGDRLMLYDFGANLAELAFEMGNEAGDLEAIARIKKTTEKYMPFIVLETFKSFNGPVADNSGMSKIGVTVTYSVNRFPGDKFMEEVVIYSGG